MPIVTPESWTGFLEHFPNAHILQTALWGQLKNEFGWKTVHVIAESDKEHEKCGVQILFRQLPLGFSLAYIPRGPVGSGWDTIWPEIDLVCQKKRAVLLKIEPDIWEGDQDVIQRSFTHPDFLLSNQEIQPPRTLVVDLGGTEDQILSRMKQKTRYNIRLAGRKGVVIRKMNDIDTFYALMQTTGERESFGIHRKAYYQRALDLFTPGNRCVLYLAEFEGQSLAGIMVFTNGNRAWYFYGASSNHYRHLMPTYLLQWRAMIWAKEQGCSEYDLWGVPDENYETLESNFLDRHDDLWGVYRFKRGFGGELRRTIQSRDRVYNPLLYKLYLWRMR
jgi:lipid II:glycine glycyltransferase (peptidoglycan interpeptide bridge formation enzyme)